MKPQLATDALLDETRYSVMCQPKFDGVRGMYITSQFTGRSLDPFTGFGVTDYFTKTYFKGLDGEMTLGSNPLDRNTLCARTTGAMSAFKGVTQMADLHWWIFDDTSNPEYPYHTRYERASQRVANLGHPRVHMVPSDLVHNRAELDVFIAGHLDSGAEGTILRNPNAAAKEGRSTKQGQELTRVKLWAHTEILVTRVIEGETNNNEQTINSLGKSERSSAKGGKVPNGRIGSIVGVLLADVLHPLSGNLLLPAGTTVVSGPGEMSIKQSAYWFQNQSEFVGKIATLKFMPHGMKDALRMATFKSLRIKEDMS